MAASDNTNRGGKAPIWLMTFADVTALMLTFFIMLFATTEVPSEKWEAVMGPMTTLFRFDESGYTALPKTNTPSASVDYESALPIDYLANVLSDNLKRDDVLKGATVRPLDDRLVLSLPTNELFAGGSAVLEVGACEAVFRLGGVFRNISNQIEIRGHAGPNGNEGATFESNWSLSLARAVSVSKALTASGYDGAFYVLGVGDSRYRHLSERLSDSRRNALSRRVDIIIYATAGVI